MVYAHLRRPAPMRTMVFTAFISSSQIYMMRTSILALPAGVSITGTKYHAFLQQILTAPLWRHGVDLRRAGAHHDAQSRERKERLQHVPFGILHAVHAIQELRARNGRMLEVRQRELAETEEPIRMAGPFDLQVVAKIERRIDGAALQLIDDGAIVDAFHRRWEAVEVVPEAMAPLGGAPRTSTARTPKSRSVTRKSQRVF